MTTSRFIYDNILQLTDAYTNNDSRNSKNSAIRNGHHDYDYGDDC